MITLLVTVIPSIAIIMTSDHVAFSNYFGFNVTNYL